MMRFNLRLDFGHVDYEALKTDDDFRREAEKLLPKIENSRSGQRANWPKGVGTIAARAPRGEGLETE
jgi:hypothetical protein